MPLCTAAGDNTLVAAVSGKKIVVHGLTAHAQNSAVDCYIASSGGTALWFSAATAKTIGGGGVVDGFQIPDREARSPADGQVKGWFETPVGEGLVLNLSAAVPVQVYVAYSLVQAS